RVVDRQGRGGLGGRVGAAVDDALLDHGGQVLLAGAVEGVAQRGRAVTVDDGGADADVVRAEDYLGARRDGRRGRVVRRDGGLLADQHRLTGPQLQGGARNRGDLDGHGVLVAGDFLGLVLEVL